MGMKFDDLLQLCASGRLDVQADSRLAGPDSVFVAIPGENQDGARYMADALAKGCTHIVCSETATIPDHGGDYSLIRHPDPREALWRLASARWQPEAESLKVIGITGTNGKTTSSYLLEKIISGAGHACGILGTVGYLWPGHEENAPLTTPDAPRLHSMLSKMASAGANWAIMEVSSHALSQQRVGGINFSGALFTNLTQDHLDYHSDLESYFRAKAILFLDLPKKDKVIAINSDDPFGRRLLELAPQALSFGLHNAMPGKRHLKGEILHSSIQGLRLKMRLGKEEWELSSPLVGQFNAMNLLGVQAMALELGFSPESFSSLENFHGVPGRLERVVNNRGLNIFVDYAHTPDALTNVLAALRGAGFRRLITVFGCGGDRDRGKRPLMAMAVAQLSDIAILTSDNPRHEDPLAIIQDARPGLAKAFQPIIEPDRREATAKAISLLEPEDALLIAGKGHENYQIIGDERIHYSDQEVAREILQCL